MDNDYSPGPMEISMKGNGRMKKDMGQAHLLGPMGTSTSGNGRMINAPV